MEAGRTYGNGWMYRMLIKILQHTDIRVLYLFMAVCVVPPTLLFSPGARVAYRFYRNILGRGIFRAVIDTYRNHVIFGQTVIDKFAMYAGHQFKIVYHGLDDYEKQTHSPQPLIQLCAHIGCSEVVGYSYDNAKPLNALVFGGENKSLMAYRTTAFGNKNIKMIPVGIGESHSDEITAALDNGEIVCAFADRVVNSNKNITTTLFGHKVALARGPFSMAVTRGLDVVMTSAMKERDGSYTVCLTPLKYDKTLSASMQKQQLADLYVAEIEKHITRHPLQWFNYSDLWTEKR